jgi:hypothetical protein
MAFAAKLSDPTALQMLVDHGVEFDPIATFCAIFGTRGQRNGIATLQILLDAGSNVNLVSR